MKRRQKERILKIALFLTIALVVLILLVAIVLKLIKGPTAEQTGSTDVTQQAESLSTQPTETVSVATDQTETQELPSPEIKLVMVGDILLHTPVEESALKEDGSYDFSHIFENTKADIEAADIAMVNQEVMIGGKELGVSGYPAFNAPYEIADELVATGFDVVCHATNHALDKGKKGILNCLDNWKSKHPDTAVVGINSSQEERDRVYVYDKDGIKIAVLNYTYGTNGISLPGDMPYAVNLLEEGKVKADIEKAHDLADFVVVCPHWGTEYSLEVSSEQKKWTQIFFDSGVDLVIGTHPHVIEPVEMISDGQHNMLVYYSLGNFVNWTSGEGAGVANRMVGGMADVTIGRDENNQVVVKDYDVIPLVCHVTPGQGGVTVYKMSDYTAEMAGQNKIINQDSTFSYEYIHKLSQDIFGEN